jgi:hypothetical protein
MTQYYLVLEDINGPTITTSTEPCHTKYAKQNQIITINDDNEIVITDKEKLFPTWSGGCGTEATNQNMSFTYSHSGLSGSGISIDLNDLKVELKSKTKAELRAENLKKAKENIQKDKHALEEKERNAIRLETLLAALETPKFTKEITHEVLNFPMFDKMLKTLSKQLNMGLDTAWSELIPQVKTKE